MGLPWRLSSKEFAYQYRRHRFYCWVRKIPWRREWLPTPVYLPGKFYGQRIAKFRLRLKKVGKTIKPFRYDLNQIPYDYTVEVTNRFKGLDLVDRVPEELRIEVCSTVQEVVTKTIPKKRNTR